MRSIRIREAVISIATMIDFKGVLILLSMLSAASRPETSEIQSRSESELWIDNQSRMIVTLNAKSLTISEVAPRPKGGCRTLELTSIPCSTSIIYAIDMAKHCPRSDTLTLQPTPDATQSMLSSAIQCIFDDLNEDPEEIEFDARVHISEFSTDQWHLPVIQVVGSDGRDAWDYTRGSDDVVVAVIDTGVDYTHPDLRTNIWINSGEIPGNGIDDDGNGFIDDVYGYDFSNDDGDPMDDNGHGTHCAGIVGGVVNIKRRVSGVSPNVRMMSIKAMDAKGSGLLSDVIAAVEYSLEMGAHITSNSFGTPDITYSRAFARLLKVIEEAGQLYVAAAGNKKRDADRRPEFPASLDSPIILSVAATNKQDKLADFSNYGARSIDLGAPGVNILSTKRKSGYKYAQGTSTATPLVAATAALVLSTIARNTTLTEKVGVEVKEIILASVDRIPALEDRTLSGGRLNAARAVRMANDKYGAFWDFDLEPSDAGGEKRWTQTVLPLCLLFLFWLVYAM